MLSVMSRWISGGGPGDRLLVDVTRRAPGTGETAVLWDGTGLVVKRVEVLPNAEPPRLRLISANPAYEPYTCLAQDAHGRPRDRDLDAADILGTLALPPCSVIQEGVRPGGAADRGSQRRTRRGARRRGCVDHVFEGTASRLQCHAAVRRSADEVIGQPLLHDMYWDTDWPDWARAVGATAGELAANMRFALYKGVIQAAVGPIQEKWRRPTPFALLLPRI